MTNNETKLIAVCKGLIVILKGMMSDCAYPSRGPVRDAVANAEKMVAECEQK